MRSDSPLLLAASEAARALWQPNVRTRLFRASPLKRLRASSRLYSSFAGDAFTSGAASPELAALLRKDVPEMTPKEKDAARNRFNRSLKTSGERARTDKIDKETAMKIASAGANKATMTSDYFKLWMRCGEKWGNVKIYEEVVATITKGLKKKPLSCL